MRLGGPVFEQVDDPGAWAAAVRRAGYSAAYCPVGLDVGAAKTQAFVEAARKADIVIAEVGAWSNPIDPDDAKRKAAIEHCQQSLAHAESVGARCCVNIVGSRNPSQWDGPHRDNLSADTFDMIVAVTRQIVDAVKPTRTAYALETMPWIFPDSADSYASLIRAIDRPGSVAVHLDPVNLVNCPSRYYDTAALIRDCFAKLGPWIKSCHAKDITLAGKLTVHLDECAPGSGALDYATYLRELDKLDADTPLMLEHLATAEEYAKAAAHIRSVARQVGVDLS